MLVDDVGDLLARELAEHRREVLGVVPQGTVDGLLQALWYAARGGGEDLLHLEEGEVGILEGVEEVRDSLVEVVGEKRFLHDGEARHYAL